jgi:hypothetical protein
MGSVGAESASEKAIGFASKGDSCQWGRWGLHWHLQIAFSDSESPLVIAVCSIEGCGLWMQCGSQAFPGVAGRVELLLRVLNCQCHQGPLPVYHCHYTPLVYKPGSIHRDMRFISRPIIHTYADSIQLKPGSLQRWNTEEELTTRRWDPKQTCTHSNILRTSESCAR